MKNAFMNKVSSGDLSLLNQTETNVKTLLYKCEKQMWLDNEKRC